MFYILKVGRIIKRFAVITEAVIVWQRSMNSLSVKFIKKQCKKGFVLRSTLNSFLLIRFHQPDLALIG